MASGILTGKGKMKTKNIELIKKIAGQYGFTLPQELAYILATVEHETNGTFEPVVESYWLDNPDAYNKKHHPNYYPYYGRGFVQLTWLANYKKFSDILGVDLVANPELVLDPTNSAIILVYGFKFGSFTGKKLSDYVGAEKQDFVKARKCINGTDRAEHIAGLAKYWMLKLNPGPK